MRHIAHRSAFDCFGLSTGQFGVVHQNVPVISRIQLQSNYRSPLTWRHGIFPVSPRAPRQMVSISDRRSKRSISTLIQYHKVKTHILNRPAYSFQYLIIILHLLLNFCNNVDVLAFIGAHTIKLFKNLKKGNLIIKMR